MADDSEQDAELLAAWRQGDQGAGERLFDRYADAVARFFENKVRREAEDLVQATFLGMLEGRDRIRAEGSFRGYLFGVAHNVLRAHLRELARRDVDASIDSMAALAPGPTSVVGMRQEHQLMLEGLRHLAIEDQILLELFYWEQLPSHEIAETVGVPPSTVRRRLQEARVRLDQRMAEIASSPELLDRTVRGMDSWVAEVREQLGARPGGPLH